MNFRLRRVSDGLAGAIVATVLLAGGAAYAATGGLDDNPKGDTPTIDDRVAREAGVTSSTEVARPGEMERRGETERESTTSTTGATSMTTSRALTGAGPVAGTSTTLEFEDNESGSRDGESGSRDGESRSRDRRTEATNGSTTSTSTTVGEAGGGTATVRTVRSAGGSVTVSQRGDSVTLVVATPAPGFAADVRKSGPDTVEVRFTSGKRESRVELTTDNGAPRERVEDR